MMITRLFHFLQPATPAPAPAPSTTAARVQLGIELHSAFANGCIYCRGPIGETETCVIFRKPLRTAHVDCFYAQAARR